MAQRISRAKQRIKTSGVPFRMPTAEERAERLERRAARALSDLQRGLHQQRRRDLQRSDLSNEAIRLTRARARPAPRRWRGRGTAGADAADRRAAPGADRTGRRADPARRAGSNAVGSAARSPRASRSSPPRCRRGSIGAYQLQAAIAAVHDEAARAEDTDWPQILALYGLLKRMSDNPMVTLNHAIAAAMVHGPRAGLELLEALDADERLAGHYRLDAVRAHLLEMAGDREAAIAHYRAAAGRTTSVRNGTTLQRREPAFATWRTHQKLRRGRLRGATRASENHHRRRVRRNKRSPRTTAPSSSRLRALMKKHAPRRTESISYGILAWKMPRMVAVVNATRHHITFAFSGGAHFEDKYGLLQGVGKVSRHVEAHQHGGRQRHGASRLHQTGPRVRAPGKVSDGDCHKLRTMTRRSLLMPSSCSAACSPPPAPPAAPPVASHWPRCPPSMPRR